MQPTPSSSVKKENGVVDQTGIRNFNKLIIILKKWLPLKFP